MTIAEFMENYYLHDSGLEKIEYDATNHTLKVFVYYCYFMQDNFKEGDRENGMVCFSFNDVEYFKSDNSSRVVHECDMINNCFLEEDGGLSLFVINYLLDDYWLITFKAKSVIFTELDS